MKKFRNFFYFLCFVNLLLAVPAYADLITKTYNIKGQVIDGNTGKPISDATVRLGRDKFCWLVDCIRYQMSGKTDQNGNFNFDYEGSISEPRFIWIKAEKEGYHNSDSLGYKDVQNDSIKFVLYPISKLNPISISIGSAKGNLYGFNFKKWKNKFEVSFDKSEADLYPTLKNPVNSKNYSSPGELERNIINNLILNTTGGLKFVPESNIEFKHPHNTRNRSFFSNPDVSEKSFSTGKKLFFNTPTAPEDGYVSSITISELKEPGILFIKTADGHFAKMELNPEMLSLSGSMNDFEENSWTVSFRFIYNPEQENKDLTYQGNSP